MKFFRILPIATILLIVSFTLAFAGPPVSNNQQPPPDATTVTIADYTAFPPFLPRVVSPNILFLLDYSASMVRPAYGDCDPNFAGADCRTVFAAPAADYNSTTPYAGYFDTNYNYTCSDGTSGQCTKGSVADNWDGNWLNWLTMTQFDILKKVVVGGDITPSPEQGNPGKIQSVLPLGKTFLKVVTKSDCLANAPDAYCATSAPQQIPYAWKEPVGAPLAEWTGDHDALTGQLATTLPFPFKFFDTTYNSASPITIGVDGIIRFGSHTDYPTDGDIPAATNLTDIIAPYWDDAAMVGAKSSVVKTFVLGTAPNRIFVVTFENIINDADATNSVKNPFTYQVLFYEAGSQLVFQYNVVWPALTFGAGKEATIGVQKGADATRFKVRKNRSVLTETVTNGTAWLMTPEARLFRITPGNLTTFSDYVFGASAADIFNVGISVNNTAKVSGACPTGYTLNKFRDSCYDHPTEGLLQDFRDGELSGLLGFRLGIMETNDNDSGKMVKHFNEKDETGWASIMSATRGRAPSANAALAEALYEAQGYFRQETTYRFNNTDMTIHGTGANCASTGNNYDPFCFQSAEQKVPCVKNYVLMVSAGNYSHDNGVNIFGDAGNSETWSNDWSIGWRATDGEAAGTYNSVANGGWLDNVAYEMRAPTHYPAGATAGDLRSDIDGAQAVGVYTVNTFAGSGNGGEILKRAARYGGFIDGNGNNTFDTGEDDKNGDTVPDTYFAASGGGDLKAQIVNAVMDILKNSASGTSVSVLSTSAGGEGALYQAYFYPAKIIDQTNERRWPGYMRAFFIDRYQNLRDDHSVVSGSAASVPDAAMSLENDRIVKMFLSPSDSSVRLKAFKDADGSGKIEGSEATPVTFTSAQGTYNSVAMDDVVSIWEGGEQLAKQDKALRNVYMWLDTDGDGKVNNGIQYNSTSGGEGDFSSLGSKSESFNLKDADGTLYNTLVPYFRTTATIYNTTTGYNELTDTTAEMEAKNLVDFVLGHDIEEELNGNHQMFRDRCIYVKARPGETVSTEPGCSDPQAGDLENSGKKGRVWPLGDIVFSTPALVAGPSENYHKIYGKTDYLAFRNTHYQRRNVVYVGANDGMLHAYNAGVYHEGDNSTITGTEQGYFTAGPTSGDNWNKGLGSELWAFLPHDLVPHIPWLACNATDRDASACFNSEYTHVFYVDSRPKITDARIFAYDDGDDTNNGTAADKNFVGIAGQNGVSHTEGWGTIMIMSMRLGGGAINVDLNGDGDFVQPDATPDTGEKNFQSAYYCFDITDPEQPPKLLWRFTDPGLGFSTSYPVISRIEAGGTTKWFMVVGSGPENKAPSGIRAYGYAQSTIKGQIFVVDLANGSSTKLDNAGTFFLANQVMGDATSIDVNRDFSVDVLYIGSSINVSNNSANPSYGKIYRITTNNNLSPANWDVTELFDVVVGSTDNSGDPDGNKDIGPVLVGPSASMDEKGNLWVFFGTGQLKNTDDMKNSDQQAFYGLKDECWRGITSTECTLTSPYTYELDDLINTTGVKVFQLSDTVGAAQQVDATSNTAACGNTTNCAFETVKSSVAAKKGWYVTLTNPTDPSPSEKMISRSSVLGGLVLFTTYQPSGDVCSIFGESYLYAMYYETGTAYRKPAIGVADTGEIEQRTYIGQGMPTSVGVAIGETVSGFIQKSTGEIITIESEPALKVKSGPSSWYGGAAGCGTSGIETIYKHIAK